MNKHECGLTARLRVLLICVAVALAGHAADLVGDEAMRLQALGAAFPGALISQGEKLTPNSRRANPAGVDVAEMVGFHDEFENEPAYTVAAPARGIEEECAAEDVVASQRKSDRRNVRFRLYRIRPPYFVLVAQYDFGQSSALSCESIARLFLLSLTGGRWQVEDSKTMPTQRHASVQTVEFPGGDGDRVLIETDVGGPAVVASVLRIFEVDAGRLHQVLSITGRIAQGPEDAEVFARRFDQARTLPQSGASFCFKKTTFAEAGRWIQPPKISAECFPRGLDGSR